MNRIAFRPNQIEDLVTQHPGVAEAAAIGVPDEKSGEAVKLFVLRSDPALTTQDILGYCKQHLTDYKVPKFVEFWSEPLPKSNLGKILRRKLRDTQQTNTAALASTAPPP